MTEYPSDAVEAVVLATDQEPVSNEAACLPPTCVAATFERGDDGQVRDEQAEGDEDSETTFVGDPKQRGQNDQHYADCCALAGLGRPPRHRQTLMVANL